MNELPGLSVASGHQRSRRDPRPVRWTTGDLGARHDDPARAATRELGRFHVGHQRLGHAVGTIISTAPGALAMAVLWREGRSFRSRLWWPTSQRLRPTSTTAARSSGGPKDPNRPPEGVALGAADADHIGHHSPAMSGTGACGRLGHCATDLGTLGGTYSTPTGINDNGVVVGSSTTGAKEQHAFAWMPTNGMVDLGTFGARSALGVRLRTSFATAVSNTGEVVGASYVPSTGAPATAIEPSCGLHPPACRSSARRPSLSVMPPQSTMWDRSSATTVVPRCGHRRADGWTLARSVGPCEPVAVNNLGQVVGTSSLQTALFAPFLPAHAFLWTASGGMVGPGHAGRGVECGRGREPERPGRRVGANRRRRVGHETGAPFCGRRRAAWWTSGRSAGRTASRGM